MCCYLSSAGASSAGGERYSSQHAKAAEASMKQR
jgi:hypothetical protein